MNYIIIILFAIALYWRTIFFNLVADDDQAFIAAQNRVRNPPKYIHKYPKWIWMILYGAGLFKDHRYDHAFTIFLNTLFTCLLYSITNNIWLSLIWIAHPINNQLTVWLNGRRYIISLILSLLAYKYIYAGFVLFPIALFFHPVSAPMIIVTAILKSPIALLWALPAILNFKHIEEWIAQRWSIQDFKEYKTFNYGKIALAIRCLAWYWIDLLLPTKFTMYHPSIWGIAELKENRNSNYAFNWTLMAFLAIILFILYVGSLSGISCLLGAFLANLAAFQWLGVWKNPTQLWAQRYASLFSVFGIYYLLEVFKLAPEDFQITLKCCFLIWCVAITFKDMGMYKNYYSFFLYHWIYQPHNTNANHFALLALSNKGYMFTKLNKKAEAMMCSSMSLAQGLYWCMNNPKPDIIHNEVYRLLNKKKLTS